MRAHSRRDLRDVNLLRIRPVRRTPWHERDGHVVLERRRPGVRRPRDLRLLVRHWLSVPRVRLDSMGSAAWRAFDGSRTVGDVAEELRRLVGGDAEPAEERLGRFVRLLHQEGLLSYAEVEG